MVRKIGDSDRAGTKTALDARAWRASQAQVGAFSLEGQQGPFAGKAWSSSGAKCSIGSHESNDLVLDDRTVSRFHCEVLADRGGARVVDLESHNGTLVDGMRVGEAWLRSGATLQLGTSALTFHAGTEHVSLPVSEASSFGSLLGESVAMRKMFALLARAAASDATVLVAGETGTGKEEAASSIHLASRRAGGPFVIVDIGGLPEHLIESELFGHERGAFTGAEMRRIGAFEEASGGTVFLDEIGELPEILQPKLLRVLEKRTVKRVGSNAHVPVDVRVIAASNRDLRQEVNAGRFRSDLYFRLAVIAVRMPSLRERPEDLSLLVGRFLDAMGLGAGAAARFRSPEFMAKLRQGSWPGNVRELRNYLERCVVFEQAVPLGEAGAAGATGDLVVDARVSYAQMRQRALAFFEQRYLKALLEAHGDNVSAAARAAGLARPYLHTLLHRHGLRGKGDA